jgi:hypothetical protein
VELVADGTVLEGLADYEGRVLVVFEAFANNIEFGRERDISYAQVNNSRKIGSEGVLLYTVYIPRVNVRLLLQQQNIIKQITENDPIKSRSSRPAAQLVPVWNVNRPVFYWNASIYVNYLQSCPILLVLTMYIDVDGSAFANYCL